MTSSLTVRQMRADILHAALLDEPVERLADIASVPRVALWRPEIRAAAASDLLREGRIAETLTGRLIVRSAGR